MTISTFDSNIGHCDDGNNDNGEYYVFSSKLPAECEGKLPAASTCEGYSWDFE